MNRVRHLRHQRPIPPPVALLEHHQPHERLHRDRRPPLGQHQPSGLPELALPPLHYRPQQLVIDNSTSTAARSSGSSFTATGNRRGVGERVQLHDNLILSPSSRLVWPRDGETPDSLHASRTKRNAPERRNRASTGTNATRTSAIARPDDRFRGPAAERRTIALPTEARAGGTARRSEGWALTPRGRRRDRLPDSGREQRSPDPRPRWWCSSTVGATTRSTGTSPTPGNPRDASNRTRS